MMWHLKILSHLKFFEQDHVATIFNKSLSLFNYKEMYVISIIKYYFFFLLSMMHKNSYVARESPFINLLRADETKIIILHLEIFFTRILNLFLRKKHSIKILCYSSEFSKVPDLSSSLGHLGIFAPFTIFRGD